MKHLAIITTHPIQYYAPVFKLLHQREQIAVKVFYTWGEAALDKYDPGFQKAIQWDTPLLDGYPYEWAVNTAPNPGSHHFKGIITPGLNNQVENWKPDAILVFGWAYQGHLSAMRHFYGKVPVFFRGDSTLLNKSTGIKSTIKKIFLKQIYNKVDCAFYVGTNNRAYYKAYGLCDDQLIFAPHAVDNDKFSANRGQEALNLRNKLNLGPDDILVLFAGKFEPTKNPLMLIESFKMIKNPNLHLLFVGNGILDSDLKNKAVADKHIHFIDFQNQSDMPALYQAADIFCLPSIGETWGLAVNEAMAAGKAIVVSDKVGCAVDLVKNNINGEIFKSGSVNELADTLGRLTANKDKLQQMGQRSSELIKPWNFIAIARAIEEKLIQR
ncbi:MAG TPA: glycosyltransferase family 4 protein [Mucilaginibacter sp.]|jgi:glycosyltransferase involved in cell wall biosynthesis|nr:glycosyltransferase family 4 protein [Mucilaginibacter sp.]